MDFSRWFLNWKTTSAGITSITGAITGLAFAIKAGAVGPEIVTGCITGVLIGIGLLFARDANVSSVDMGLQKEQPKATATTVVTPDPSK